MAHEITQFLVFAQSADAEVRAAAEGNLRQLQEQDLPSFLLSLSVELAEKPIESRILAGILLKNSLDAKDAGTKENLVQQWAAIDTSVKLKIKGLLLGTLGSPAPEVRHTASQVIAKIASIEIPRKEWPELIGLLLANMTQQEKPASVKQATLETLGYVCEEISHGDLVQDEVDSVLTAVVRGMNVSEPEPVRLAATRALSNTIDFAQSNFENERERDHIMNVVFETAAGEGSEIRRAAYECLVSIASTCYKVLGPYMETIFQLTEKTVRREEVPVTLKAIEFWSTICDKELEVPQAGDSSPPHSPHSQFIEKALPLLVPLLMGTLEAKEGKWPQDDDGAWNVMMAGRICLGLVARIVGDAILPLVEEFAWQSLTKNDWRAREAAVFAFGSIFEGLSVEKLVQAVRDYLDFFLDSLEDDGMSEVRYAAAWALCRIFQSLDFPIYGCIVIAPCDLPKIIRVLLKSLKDEPHVAEKVCGAIYYLFHGYDEDAGPRYSLLTEFIQDTIRSLIATADWTDSNASSSRSFTETSNLRSSAYVALIEVVRCSNLAETSHILAEFLPVIMAKLEETFDLQIISSDDREKQGDLQAVLCGVLQVLIQKLGSTEETKVVILQAADQIMTLFLKVFSCRSSTVHEEAMLATGALANATGPQFERYMKEFYKYLEMGLQNFAEYKVCAISVGVVGVICRALDEKVLPYCDGIMTHLLNNLSSSELHRSVKPPIFSCFVWVVLAIGEHFEKYASRALKMMHGAAQICANIDDADEDMIEYGNELRASITEACALILHVFKKSEPDLMLPHTGRLLDFIEAVGKDPHRDEDLMTASKAVLRALSVQVASGVLAANDEENEVLLEEKDRLLRESIKFLEE